MTSAIYAIVNNVTCDMYVGSAVNVNRRWNAHRNLLLKQCHYNLRLQRAYDKYGGKAFDWEIVQFVDNKTKLIAREQFWINFLRLNIMDAQLLNPTWHKSFPRNPSLK